jgi:hypothetical protein
MFDREDSILVLSFKIQIHSNSEIESKKIKFIPAVQIFALTRIRPPSPLQVDGLLEIYRLIESGKAEGLQGSRDLATILGRPPLRCEDRVSRGTFSRFAARCRPEF